MLLIFQILLAIILAPFALVAAAISIVIVVGVIGAIIFGLICLVRWLYEGIVYGLW